MNVLIVSMSTTGGAGIAARRLAKALRTEGVDARLLVLDGEAESLPLSRWDQQYVGWNRKFHKAWSRILVPMKAARQAKTLAGRSDRAELFSHLDPLYSLLGHPWFQQADVVHFHWASPLFPWTGTRLPKKVVVLTLHDLNWLTGGCHYTEGCRGFEVRCERCPQLSATRVPRLAEDQFRRKSLFLQRNPEWVRALVGPSRWVCEEARVSKLWSNRQVVCIPNAHDEALYRPVKRAEARRVLGLPEDVPLIALVGHSLGNQRKGADYVLPLFEEPHWHWLVVGRQAPPGNDKIHHFGVVQDERLMALLLAAASILVLPSREENFSNLALEARLCGTPVVAFSVGGNVDAVAPPSGGRLAEAMSTEALAEAIRAELEANRSQDEIAEVARASVGSSVVAQAHLALYQSLVDTQPCS